jgi:hypothetical protein
MDQVQLNIKNHLYIKHFNTIRDYKSVFYALLLKTWNDLCNMQNESE